MVAASAVVTRRRQSGLSQRGRGDDAQRAFAADEQVAQVVAGVVPCAGPDRPSHTAVGRDHLQPQAQLARIAEAQHLGAAGVGRQVAADGAAAFGGQVAQNSRAGIRRGLPQPPVARSRLRPSGQVGAVDVAHPSRQASSSCAPLASGNATTPTRPEVCRPCGNDAGAAAACRQAAPPPPARCRPAAAPPARRPR